MENNEHHLQQLREIRQMMVKSSRFLSLSGLSGIVAGIFALLGAAAAFIYFDIGLFEPVYTSIHTDYLRSPDFYLFIILDALAVLVFALFFAAYFTMRKSKRDGVPLWGYASKRLVINLLIPLVAGGIFCIILFEHGLMEFVAPATLVFYGLALLNASPYTVSDIRYLGVSELALGLIAMWWPGYGLLFWTIGFGLLHIIYGGVMYFKYER